MNNSGLENILEDIYGGNAVQRMLQGKAFSRALRGNLKRHSRKRKTCRRFQIFIRI